MPKFVKTLILVYAAVSAGFSIVISTALSIVGGAENVEWGDDITMLLGAIILVLAVIADELRTQNRNTHGTE